jgi:hypothetical protein
LRTLLPNTFNQGFRFLHPGSQHRAGPAFERVRRFLARRH